MGTVRMQETTVAHSLSRDLICFLAGAVATDMTSMVNALALFESSLLEAGLPSDRAGASNNALAF